VAEKLSGVPNYGLMACGGDEYPTYAALGYGAVYCYPVTALIRP